VERKYLHTKYAFVIFVSVTSSRLWSFHGLPDTFFDVIEFLSAISLLSVFIWGYNKYDHTKPQFTINVVLLLLLPFLSAISASLFHDQSLYHSTLILRTNFVWLLYFALHIFNIPQQFVIKWMTIVGVVWAVLTIGQQFTYPYFFFYTRNDESGSEFIRAGMYRFMVNPHHFGLFLVVYYYNKFLLKWKMSSGIFVLIGLLGYYYFATRQFAVAALICMVILSFAQPGQMKIYATLIITLAIAVLVLNRDSLFDDYIQLTNEQLGSGEDIRILSAKHFLFDYWPHWITALIGNGMEHMNSPYGEQMLFLNEVFSYYRSDVGIIGTLHMFGIFYVCNIIWINVKGLRQKYYNDKKSYLKVFFINTLMLLIISENHSHSSAIPFYCFVLYLVDKSYQKKVINTTN
jgi:hypothetical protein